MGRSKRARELDEEMRIKLEQREQDRIKREQEEMKRLKKRRDDGEFDHA